MFKMTTRLAFCTQSTHIGFRGILGAPCSMMTSIPCHLLPLSHIVQSLRFFPHFLQNFTSTGRHTMYTPHFTSVSLHLQPSKPTPARTCMMSRVHTSMSSPSDDFYPTIRHFSLIHCLIQTGVFIRQRHQSFIIHLNLPDRTYNPITNDPRIAPRAVCGRTTEAWCSRLRSRVMEVLASWSVCLPLLCPYLRFL
jgi:hypothetical protein